jgi:TfoX/Sxy family transcriptional regulator of competence genes
VAFNEKLAERIREALVEIPDVEEKHMFGGSCFMVKGKMCIGVIKDDLMCRIDPVLEEASSGKKKAAAPWILREGP